MNYFQFSYCTCFYISILYLLLGGAGADVGPPEPDPESWREAMGLRGALKIFVNLSKNILNYFRSHLLCVM